MLKALCIIIAFLVCITLNAQNCWGVMPDSGKVTLHLYPAAQPLKWYDFSTYKFRGHKKQWVWGAYLVAGILHGGREAYHAEPTVFEKRLNAAPLSFWGSEQWKRNYFSRDPENGHKPNLFNPVRDYYHFSGAMTKAVWIGGAFTVGVSNQPMKYRVLDMLIGALITSGTASLTYNLLR